MSVSANEDNYMIVELHIGCITHMWQLTDYAVYGVFGVFWSSYGARLDTVYLVLCKE